MKAKELMIDDWVLIDRPDKYAGAKAQIKSLIFHKEDDGQYFSAFIHDELGIVRREVFNEDLRPIPLTAEILEKNGFVANKHVYPYPYYEYTNEEDKVKVGFAFPQGNRTSYKEPWVYIDSENVFIEHLPCIFVHQLQQILRFCGITLNIEV